MSADETFTHSREELVPRQRVGHGHGDLALGSAHVDEHEAGRFLCFGGWWWGLVPERGEEVRREIRARALRCAERARALSAPVRRSDCIAPRRVKGLTRAARSTPSPRDAIDDGGRAPPLTSGVGFARARRERRDRERGSRRKSSAVGRGVGVDVAFQRVRAGGRGERERQLKSGRLRRATSAAAAKPPPPGKKTHTLNDSWMQRRA